MGSLLQDVGYGARSLRRSPGFAAAAIITIALGIGVNTATFGIVNVLALKPLVYKDPERVAFVLGWNNLRQQRRFNIRLADALDVGAQAPSIADIAAYAYWSANLTGADQPERLQAYRVTVNTFALLGVDALRGRTLSAADGQPGAPAVAVISHGLWQRRFGASPSTIGQTIALDGRPHTIVGVMPQRFEFPVFNFKGELWAPLEVERTDRAASPNIVAVARLRPGASYARARSEVNAVMERLERDYPATNRGLGAEVLEMRRLGVDEAAQLTVLVMGAVALVLLLACANVANLLMARAIGRDRELAVRAALGASRRRIVRQLLTESLLLAVSGAILGVGAAAVALSGLRAMLPDALLTTVPNVLDLGVDRVTLAFAAGATIACAALFGAGPALRATRRDLQDSLKSTGGSAGARHQRLRAALTVAEVAVSLVLLVAAGLLVRTFTHLQQIDTGFNPDSVVTLTMSLPEYRYPDDAARLRMLEQTIDRVAVAPGVASAALVNVLPFSTYNDATRYVTETDAADAGREPSADYRVITPEYFRTLQLPLLAGRAFDTRDRESGDPVVIVSRELARQAFGEADPVGRRLKLGPVDGKARWLTIVGIVGDVLHSGIRERPQPVLYRPLAQAPADTMMLAARVSGDPDSRVIAIRASVAAVDPLQPVFHVTTLRRLVDAALIPNTAAMSMMGLFGGLALLLATVGIYGVVSYAVSQQTREFGVRVALGASPRDVRMLVLRRGLSIVGIGAAVGLVAAAGTARVMSGILFGVAPIDLPTYLGVATVLVLIGGLASYLPARRAMRVDPVTILRAE